MTTKKLVSLGGLGLCEHCGTLITIEGMPVEAIDSVWRCPKCEGELSGTSFGYDGDNKKIKWVGPEGKWTGETPVRDFDIGGNWSVQVEPIQYPLY